jgi:hypothetical protein
VLVAELVLDVLVLVLLLAWLFVVVLLVVDAG